MKRTFLLFLVTISVVLTVPGSSQIHDIFTYSSDGNLIAWNTADLPSSIFIGENVYNFTNEISGDQIWEIEIYDTKIYVLSRSINSYWMTVIDSNGTIILPSNELNSNALSDYFADMTVGQHYLYMISGRNGDYLYRYSRGNFEFVNETVIMPNGDKKYLGDLGGLEWTNEGIWTWFGERVESSRGDLGISDGKFYLVNETSGTALKVVDENPHLHVDFNTREEFFNAIVDMEFINGQLELYWKFGQISTQSIVSAVATTERTSFIFSNIFITILIIKLAKKQRKNIPT